MTKSLKIYTRGTESADAQINVCTIDTTLRSPLKTMGNASLLLLSFYELRPREKSGGRPWEAHRTGAATSHVWMLLHAIASLLLVGRAECSSPRTSGTNLRPIIGIFTQPTGREESRLAAGESNTEDSYIAASYVKFIESAGARAVPVHYDASEDELRSLFSSINGMLFPGGGTSLANTTQFTTSARLLLNLALEANDKGDYFPVWGTCMGFQLLTMLAAKDDSVLCDGCFDSESLAIPLDYTPAAAKSRLFGSLSSDLYKAAASLNITDNAHHSGFDPSVFRSNANLAQFYSVLSTNQDRKGMPFVSSIESVKYPVYATQWHPEKAQFEWVTGHSIPHEPEAVILSQAMANWLVGEARKSQHAFPTSKAEEDALIYNYSPIKDPEGYFEQIYLWKSTA